MFEHAAEALPLPAVHVCTYTADIVCLAVELLVTAQSPGCGLFLKNVFFTWLPTDYFFFSLSPFGFLLSFRVRKHFGGDLWPAVTQRPQFI